MRFLFLALLVSIHASAAAGECGAPPVKTNEQAICLAKQFAEQKKPAWELAYQAKEEPTAWLVSYTPVGSVRGGAGDLRIDKANGRVSVVQLYR